MMTKKTQKQIIKQHLRKVKEWVVGFKLHGLETEFGFIGSSGPRTCRKLASEGIIEGERRGKYVFYRAKKPKAFQIFSVAGRQNKIRIPIWEK